MKKAVTKPKFLIAIGTSLAIAFAILSMSTGMWGCGPACNSFIVAFWLAVGVVVYGIWLVFRNKRTTRDS